jgi:hypothetical protein
MQTKKRQAESTEPKNDTTDDDLVRAAIHDREVLSGTEHMQATSQTEAAPHEDETRLTASDRTDPPRWADEMEVVIDTETKTTKTSTLSPTRTKKLKLDKKDPTPHVKHKSRTRQAGKQN